MKIKSIIAGHAAVEIQLPITAVSHDGSMRDALVVASAKVSADDKHFILESISVESSTIDITQSEFLQALKNGWANINQYEKQSAPLQQTELIGI